MVLGYLGGGMSPAAPEFPGDWGGADGSPLAEGGRPTSTGFACFIRSGVQWLWIPDDDGCWPDRTTPSWDWTTPAPESTAATTINVLMPPPSDGRNRGTVIDRLICNRARRQPGVYSPINADAVTAT